MIHLHPQAAVILDACGHEVRLITLDHAYYLRRVVRVPFAHNGSDELADTAAEAARDCDAIIMGNHGCSTLGDTIAMAYRRALQLEDAAESTFRCLSIGNTDATFPPEALEGLRHADEACERAPRCARRPRASACPRTRGRPRGLQRHVPRRRWPVVARSRRMWRLTPRSTASSTATPPERRQAPRNRV